MTRTLMPTLTRNLTRALTLCAIAALAACAKPTVTDVAMPGDETATCSQLKNEYTMARGLIADAEAEKGVTGDNVARLVLFWPAIIGTQMNANEAIDAANARQVHLLNIMRGKQCEGLAELVG